MYKIRIILDAKEDVLRTLTIDENCNLEQLHYAVSNAFGFDGKEMASFYKTDNDWNQGNEIPLFSIDEISDTNAMKDCIIKNELIRKNDKLIYVYDFMSMWSFYVELIDKSKEMIDEAKIVLSVGEIPDKAPDKEFKAEFDMDSFDDEFNDGFDGFENIDDIDTDTY